MSAARQTTARSTPQRRAVLSQLQGGEDFTSAQDLHARLRDRGESVSLATTYRILQGLSATGDVDMLRSPEGEALYRMCREPEHHHHLVCRRCGTAVELQVPQFEQWASRVAAEHGFTDVDHTIEIMGLCAQCTAEAPSDHERP